MITYSIIQKSQFEGALRIDAEFYDPYYFDLEKKLKRKKWDYLGNLIVFNRRGIQPKYSDTPTKYRAVVSQNILEDFLDVNNLPFIDEDFFNSKQAQAVKIKPFDILIYTTGANIGRTNIFYPKTIEAIASNHVNIIRVDPSKINQLYLGVFLQSKIGRDWTDRWASGSDQEEIYPEDFEKFPVLIADDNVQNEVANLVLKSFEFIESSNRFYSQAENLLLEELGLKDFKIEDDLFYVVNLSEIKSAHRADAEYFQPKYEKLISKIKKYGAEPLLRAVENIPARFNPKSQSAKIFRYVELSNITSSIGTIDGFLEVSGEEAPSRAKRILKANDVIISSVEGSLEKVALVGKDQEGYLASNGFFQFRSKNILPEVLLVLAKSIIFQMQLEKQCAGTILTAVPKEAIQNLLIPILPKPTQQKIADLVQQSHEARKKAKQLLEEAKRQVEKLINPSLTNFEVR